VQGNNANFAIRNVFQVLGHDWKDWVENDPRRSRMLISWTENGEIKGGTGQAIRIAKAYGVKVYNLAIPRDREYVLKSLNITL
jgi:hypothetical protein